MFKAGLIWHNVPKMLVFKGSEIFFQKIHVLGILIKFCYLKFLIKSYLKLFKNLIKIFIQRREVRKKKFNKDPCKDHGSCPSRYLMIKSNGDTSWQKVNKLKDQLASSLGSLLCLQVQDPNGKILQNVWKSLFIFWFTKVLQQLLL